MAGVVEFLSSCKSSLYNNRELNIMKKSLQILIAVFFLSSVLVLAGGGDTPPSNTWSGDDLPPQEQLTIDVEPVHHGETIVIVKESSNQIIVAIIGALGVIGATVVGVYLTKKKKA